MDILFSFYEYLMHICNNVVRIWQTFCKNKSCIWLLNTHLQNLSKRLSQCHAHDQRNDPSKANAIGLSLGIEAILEIESMSSMYYYYYYYYYRFPFPYIITIAIRLFWFLPIILLLWLAKICALILCLRKEDINNHVHYGLH